MKIKREECEFIREDRWNRIRHLPTDRCVCCVDNEVTDDELFEHLEFEMNRLESMGRVNNHEKLTFIDIEDVTVQ